MAAASRSIERQRVTGSLTDQARENLEAQWLGLNRRPSDFPILWDLYWRVLGPLAPVPTDIHVLEEVLLR